MFPFLGVLWKCSKIMNSKLTITDFCIWKKLSEHTVHLRGLKYLISYIAEKDAKIQSSI